MKKTPLIIALLSTFILFTVLGIVGSFNVYALEEQNVIKQPFLTRVFTAMNDDIYPWDMLNSEKRDSILADAKEKKEMEAKLLAKKNASEGNEEVALEAEDEDANEAPTAVPTASPTVKPSEAPTPSPTPEFPEGRYEPLFESTYDEYINHISADIYGDMGVLRAAKYEYKEVDLSYFDDALFIGDSRTVGLRNYTALPEHADFLCETSLTIWKVFDSDFKGSGTVESALQAKDYGKIYLMVGVNELGTGTTEDFMKKYTEVVDKLHELEPDALIIIQAIMNVDEEKSTTDAIFNNNNIMARNHAIATLADNSVFFYIDENEALTDENGYLREDLKGDHLHLMGSANELWLEFLLKHGV